jgi:hypothetical protein
MVASCFAAFSACGRIWIFAWRRDGSDSFVASTDAMKLRKIFRREAARRQPFVGHARKLHNVPAITAGLALTL